MIPPSIIKSRFKFVLQDRRELLSFFKNEINNVFMYLGVMKHKIDKSKMDLLSTVEKMVQEIDSLFSTFFQEEIENFESLLKSIETSGAEEAEKNIDKNLGGKKLSDTKSFRAGIKFESVKRKRVVQFITQNLTVKIIDGDLENLNKMLEELLPKLRNKEDLVKFLCLEIKAKKPEEEK
jgi:hypothetical protein